MFQYDELVFMVDALSGVQCSPETFAGNLESWVPYGGANTERIEYRKTIAKVAALPAEQRAKLHSQVENFWEIGTLPDIWQRMKEVGLLEWESKETMSVKVFFDKDQVAIGVCSDDPTVPLYAGDYFASEYLQLADDVIGQIVGKTYLDLIALQSDFFNQRRRSRP